MATVEKKFLAKLTPEDVGGQARSVVFVLGNGVKVVACLDDYTPEMRERLAIHGLSQKVGDAASGFSKDRDFHSAFGAMQSVADGLAANSWSNRSGGGTSDLVQVLAELSEVSLERAQEVVDQMNEEQLKAVRAHKKIKAALAELAAKRANEAAKTADAASLEDALKAIGLGS